MIDRIFGLAFDGKENIMTIRTYESTYQGSHLYHTDILIISTKSGEVVHKIPLNNFIKMVVDMTRSKCRFLHFDNQTSTLFVGDLGLNCVYVLKFDLNCNSLFGNRKNSQGKYRINF